MLPLMCLVLLSVLMVLVFLCRGLQMCLGLLLLLLLLLLLIMSPAAAVAVAAVASAGDKGELACLAGTWS